jgi:CarD family transcriptional regulator
VLRVLDRDITIKVPCDRAEELGLRTILPEDHVPKIFRILREKSKVRGYRTWNKRFREYSQKLRSGSPFEIAEVLRDLMLLQNSKDLSFGERKLLDQARALLIKELSFACESDENELVERVTKTVRTGQQKKSAGN